MGALWMIAIAAAVTYMWRAIGVVAAGKIGASSPYLRLATCIAYAMVAALIGRMIIYPTGGGAEIGVGIRICAALLGLFAFFIGGRNVAAGAWTGAAAIVILNYVVEDL